ncbi:hypothetical protein TNCV_1677791 [Trichonephila clavipes]|nr:hypothetical protein TNCV_1677791 [Trichonephila clavipes]
MPLKTCRAEGMMNVKSAVAQSPPIGVMGKFGEGVPSQMSFPSLGSWFKIKRSVTNCSHVTLLCDVNKH